MGWGLPPDFPLQDDEYWAQCPWCGTWLRAVLYTDPLKHHMEYCDQRPSTPENDYIFTD